MNNENWSKCTCGKHLLKGDDLIDTVYPCNRERTVYNAYCNTSMGGCGRIVYGSNLEILEKRWNLGITDESDINYKFDNIEEIKKFLKTVE